MFNFLQNKHTALRKPPSEYSMEKQYQFVLSYLTHKYTASANGRESLCLTKWLTFLPLRFKLKDV